MPRLPKSYTLRPLYLRLLVAETFGQPPAWTDTLAPGELATLTEYALIRLEEQARLG